VNNVPSQSSCESTHSDDLHHKHSSLNVGLKISCMAIPNVVSSTNVVVVPVIVDHSIIPTINILVSDSKNKIYVENHERDRASIDNNMDKGKQVVIQSESSAGWPAIIEEYLFPDIVAYSLPFGYIF
jgi:hypothetical protein